MLPQNEQTIQEQAKKVEALSVEALTSVRRALKENHYHYVTAYGYIDMLQDALIALKISIKKELK